MKKTMLRRKILGISLLEVMLSLSIIAIILVMASRYFLMASNNEKVNQARAQISAVLSAATSYLAENPTVSSVQISDLVNAGSLTQSADVASTKDKLISPWSSPLTIAGAPAGKGSVITVAVIDSATCQRLSTSFTDSSCNGNVISVPIGNATT